MFSAIENSSTSPRRCRSSGMCPTPGVEHLARARVRERRARRRGSCRCSRLRRPAIASISSVWPFPSTPAMPTISPARTVEARRRAPSRCRGRRGRGGPRPRAATSPGCAGGFSTRSSTSRPTIARASDVLGRALARHGLDLLAAPQHGDPVGDLEHLVQLVADEDDRLAVGPQAARRSSNSSRRLLRRQHGGRLVEDEDLGAAVERLQDLDALLLADGDVGDERGGIDGEPVLLRQLAHALLGCRARRAARRRVPARSPSTMFSATVITGMSMKCWCTMPMPALDRVLRRGEVDRLALHEDLALVRLVEPVEDVHQRRLAGAVLAEQRVDLALAHVEVDVVVGDDAREPFVIPRISRTGSSVTRPRS